ncbi:MAG: haloacid dehalogenase type II [Methylibium sp.]|uniref:haloacid dehalogenase type II n=1 Tax=Methylibium sp. TaxID=2067992 RepID=UPI00184B670D|nr:haloacid dehalogenase type II [Methylibium sp.]MBA3595977.1 haloacid dehalogenase type II [Methylibium sp.]
MNEIKALVFDLYGTLYDVHSVAARCETCYPGRGREISAMWRQKQIEYTWLRSLMNDYCDFEKATEDALVYTCRYLKLELEASTQQLLCNEYLQLAPFPEVPAALRRMRTSGLPLAILSNGSRRSIHEVVSSSGLEAEFAHLISVDDVRVFKPHPSVYQLAERTLRLARAQILFVSSNAWDAAGARHYGYPVCWVNRASNCFEELGQQPDLVVDGIDTLARHLNDLQTSQS